MITKSYRYFEGKSVYCVRGVLSDHWGNGREEGNIGRALQLNPEPTMIVARPIG
jgi:hypothetical protein